MVALYIEKVSLEERRKTLENAGIAIDHNVPVEKSKEKQDVLYAVTSVREMGGIWYQLSFSSRSKIQLLMVALHYEDRGGNYCCPQPAFVNNPHLDIEEIVKGNNADVLKKTLKSYGLIISALANHPEGQIEPPSYSFSVRHPCA
jgi:hypothetical protein